MPQNSAALAAPPFHVDNSRLGAPLVASGHRLVAWGERVSARRSSHGSRVQARKALERHADARRDAQAMLQSGLPHFDGAARTARGTAPERSAGPWS
jgi:hypothetical protein